MRQVLATSRLIIREMAPGDLDFVAEMLAHPEVMGFFPRCYCRREAETWLRQQQQRYAAEGHGYWLALQKSTGESVGQVGLMRVEIDGVQETGLGYLIHRPFWGKGFATEAAAACVDYAFGVLGRPRVVCPVRPENEASVRVARRIGMRLEKRSPFAGFDHLIYARARDDATPGL